MKILFTKSKEESDISAFLDKKSGTKTVKIEPKSFSPNKRKIDGDHSNPSPPKQPKLCPVIKQENAGKASFLHDVFTDMKLYLAPSVKDIERMKRYVIAYNGDVLEVLSFSLLYEIYLLTAFYYNKYLQTPSTDVNLFFL